jgi:Holliday junction resolvase RusA-like endonuclease
MTKSPIPYYFNPIYDLIIIVIGADIPSKRLSYSINALGEKVIKQPYRGQQFESALAEGIKSYSHEGLPFSGRILLSLNVSLTKSNYRIKDVDNIAKTILDSLKGIIYKDDNQIDTLVVNKSISNNPSFSIGIYRLRDEDDGKILPKMTDTKPFATKKKNTLMLIQNE